MGSTANGPALPVKLYVTLRKNYESDEEYKRLTLIIEGKDEAQSKILVLYRRCENIRLEVTDREGVLRLVPLRGSLYSGKVGR